MIKKTFSININLASEVTIHQTYFYHFSVAKFLKGFNNGMYTGMNLIDLQKAFDTTKHKILIDKLLPIGFSKNSISRYESFLAECHFTVRICKLGFKIHKYFMASFNFRSYTVFLLHQLYESNCRMQLVLICR